MLLQYYCSPPKHCSSDNCCQHHHHHCCPLVPARKQRHARLSRQQPTAAVCSVVNSASRCHLPPSVFSPARPESSKIHRDARRGLSEVDRGPAIRIERSSRCKPGAPPRQLSRTFPVHSRLCGLPKQPAAKIRPGCPELLVAHLPVQSRSPPSSLAHLFTASDWPGEG